MKKTIEFILENAIEISMAIILIGFAISVVLKAIGVIK